jgi:hypothetical protein
MTTATLVSGIGYNQNQGGPAVPAPTVVNTGALIELAQFTLTVSPTTGWGTVAINWGPDGVNWPGQKMMIEAPTGTGAVTETSRFHAGTNQPSNTPDGAQYFKAEVMSVSPGASLTLSMTY